MTEHSYSFGAQNRSAILREASRSDFDLAIIGGGITGAACLRDAAQRGMRAILFERDDFAAATSGYSSKLIHGGLRYLETGDLRLVYESLRERSILLATAPQWVRPLPFLYPVYSGHDRALWKVTAGVYLYHLLTGFRGDVPGPSRLSPAQTFMIEPRLLREGLRGAVRYYDAQTSDVDLTLATVFTGWTHGGLACNHAKVVRLLEDAGAVRGVRVRDQLTQETYDIRATRIIHATGPFSDLTHRELLGDATPRLRMTKGVHLILDEAFSPPTEAVLMISPRDQRVMFTLPWMGRTLVGTTDTDYEGDPTDAKATPHDIAYILEAYNAYFPTAHATDKNVQSSFAGIRPLIRQDKDSPSKVSREHQIDYDRPEVLSVIGGKLTSHRAMAEEILDRLVRDTPGWKHRFSRGLTASSPLRETRRLDEGDLTPSEIQYAYLQEMAATPDDILFRRSKLAYLAPDRMKELRERCVQELARLGAPSQP